MRIFFSSMFVLFFVLDAMACDICQIYIGLRPKDNFHKVGINYRNRILRGEMPLIFNANTKAVHDDILETSKGENLSYVPVEEHYQVVELRAQFAINQKWMIRASLPYLVTDSWINHELNTAVNGLGDPWISLNRTLIASKQNDDERALGHRLRIGIGVKFPLGSTTDRYNDNAIAYDMQPGSGSYDYLGTAEYMLRYGSVGFSAAIVYKYNTSNLSQYQFGNTTMLNAQVFTFFEGEERFIMPYLSVFQEFAAKDHSMNEEISQSGGQVSFAGIGLELGIGNLSFEFGSQLAFHDHLKNSIAPAKYRITGGISYYFNSTKQ